MGRAWDYAANIVSTCHPTSELREDGKKLLVWFKFKTNLLANNA